MSHLGGPGRRSDGAVEPTRTITARPRLCYLEQLRGRSPVRPSLFRLLSPVSSWHSFQSVVTTSHPRIIQQTAGPAQGTSTPDPRPSPVQRSPTQRSKVQPSPALYSPAPPSPAQPSPAQLSTVQPSPAQPSPAQASAAQPSAAQRSSAQLSPAQPSPAQPSSAQPSPAQPSRAVGQQLHPLAPPPPRRP